MSGLVWRDSADPDKECCQFDHNGRRYIAHRVRGTTEVIKLSKRDRTNRDGLHYWPLKLKGAAARKVLAAVFSGCQ